MDNRTLLTVLMCLTIWYGWLAIFPPELPPETVEETAAVAPADVVPASAATTAEEVIAPAGPIEDVPFAACGARAVIDTTDGAIRALTLDDYLDRYQVQALYDWALSGFSGEWLPYGTEPGPVQLLTSEARGLTASAGAMDVRAPYNQIVSKSDNEVVTRSLVDGIEIERRVREATGTDGACALTVDVTWRNVGTVAFTGPLWVGIHDRLPEAGGRYEVAMAPWVYADGDIDYITDVTELEQPVEVAGEVGWFGLADTYFATLAVVGTADAPASGSAQFSRVAAEEGFLHGSHYRVADRLGAGESVSETFRVYVGPKNMEALAAFDERLTAAIDLGFLAVFASVLLAMLKMVYMVVGDWALAIIGLTFLIKAAFFPLTQKSFKSQQAMQVVQPELKKIQETYRDQPEELQRRTVELFKERGVNPLSGCLPMMVQMPVWFALYSVLLSAVELYHTKFLYLEDLTQPDPFLALPILVMALMFFQQRMMPTGNMDPTQARMMKMMPLVFGLLFFMFPAGLALYVLVNMLLSIIQQWYIKRTFQGVETEPAAQGV